MQQPYLIAHIVYSFSTGGLEKGIATLVRNSSPLFKHVIICLSGAGDSVQLLPENTRVISLGKKKGNSFLFILKLAGLLRKLKPDLIHTRNWSGMDGILAARFANIKTLIHGEHGWDMEDPYGTNPKRVFIRKLFSRWVKEYTCVSAEMETWLKHTIRVSKRVTQIYNGVDTDVFNPHGETPNIRSEMRIPSNAPVIGIVARLDPIKDHSNLFQAFSLVRKQVPDAGLLVVGDGPERHRLEKISSKGIVFLGNRLDVPGIMREFDIFVLTSLNEGISNTILEAMATGLPIVATRVGGNVELAGNSDFGILVEPGNPEQLAGVLLSYLKNQTRMKQHGALARKTAIHQYSVAAMVQKYETVYRRVIEA